MKIFWDESLPLNYNRAFLKLLFLSLDVVINALLEFKLLSCKVEIIFPSTGSSLTPLPLCLERLLLPLPPAPCAPSLRACDLFIAAVY